MYGVGHVCFTPSPKSAGAEVMPLGIGHVYFGLSPGVCGGGSYAPRYWSCASPHTLGSVGAVVMPLGIGHVLRPPLGSAGAVVTPLGIGHVLCHLPRGLQGL